MDEREMSDMVMAMLAVAREINMQNRIRTLELLYKNSESYTEEGFEDDLRDILNELTN